MVDSRAFFESENSKRQAGGSSSVSSEIPARPHMSMQPPALCRVHTPRLEAELAQERNKMALGIKDPATGEFKACSSVQVCFLGGQGCQEG